MGQPSSGPRRTGSTVNRRLTLPSCSGDSSGTRRLHLDSCSFPLQSTARILRDFLIRTLDRLAKVGIGQNLAMKEIIYIQAGNMSNYVGTHFWNAQQSYFTYSGDKDILIDHDVSFREGVSPRVCHSCSMKDSQPRFKHCSQGEPTYCPRVLQFDRKGTFSLFF